MGGLNAFIVRVKRADTPFYRAVKSIGQLVLRPRGATMPRILRPALRGLYELHYLVIQTVRMLVTVAYRHPLFQGRCASFGKNVTLDGLPFVDGHVDIHVGNNVWLGGRFDISSGKWLDHPQLVIQDHVEIGWNVLITVNREVVIEEHVRISADCRISDSDGHPKEADLRRRNAPVNPKDIRPVRICRDAWIGRGAHILKGVTIGEGAVIGANSVVITDIPPYSMALGNPAEIYFKNYGKPKRALISATSDRIA